MQTTTAIDRYKLAPPSEQDVFASLDRLVGQEESRRMWASACKRVGLFSGKATTLDDLEKALLELKNAKGMAAIAASSMVVRVRSFRTISTINR